MANMDDKPKSVNGEGYISDESSFYGDEEEKARLEKLAADSDVDKWRRHLINQVHARVAELDAKARRRSVRLGKIKLYNPYEGVNSGRQLSETVSAFLERLPPSKTLESEYGPWIYIANPYYTKNHDEKHNEKNWKTFTQVGQSRLLDWLSAKRDIEERLEGRPESIIKTAVTKERKVREADLRDLAIKCRCDTGKWMIFRQGKDADEAWALIADATARDELGIAAKVATRSGREHDYNRVICVYTANFSDFDDVKRVHSKLREMGLCGMVKRIYYKTDAWTALGVYRDQSPELPNEHGFETTLYSSKDMLEPQVSKKRKRG